MTKEDIEYIICHHSLTPDGWTVNTRAIRKYHIQQKGWIDIGYHYLLEKVKGEQEIFIGRTLLTKGAHTLGMNGKSLGICFVGNYDLIVPPQEMWQRGLDLIGDLCRIFDIPYNKVCGHNDFANRTCPGKLFDMDSFRADLKRIL